MNTFNVLIWAVLAVGIDAGLMRISRAGCPEVVTKPDFEIPPYAGTWYEYSKLPNTFQDGMECSSATYAEIGPGEISVVNTGVLADGSPTIITGSARQDRPDEPAYLTLSFPGRPDGDYRVLDTDYTNYTAIYSCSSLGFFKLEFAWLMGRETKMSPEVEQLGLSAFTRFGIDVSQFTLTNQDDTCIYSH